VEPDDSNPLREPGLADEDKYKLIEFFEDILGSLRNRGRLMSVLGENSKPKRIVT
jgi:hypothetical protein